MAKGKNGSGSSSTSKGERRSSMKTRATDPISKAMNAQKAWLNGSNPWVTIANPNREETNKRFIKVRMNDMMHGSAKEREKSAYIMK